MQFGQNILDETRTILTVSELNQTVKNLLEQAFPPLWLEGEISNFVSASSGHWYFSLKDKQSQIRCALFQAKRKNFTFTPENGMHVVLRGKISLYEPRGDYQFIADYMEPTGDGALRQAFELLKTKLNAEGLFAAIHKKTLPALPKTIGVITSPTGAAIRDILSVLNRRFPAMRIIIYPSLVQGAQASQQIVQAIQTANKHNHCEVLILARGGGSIEDLWPFNEEIVARAIFASELPIISAVGHEIDFTIADFVADVRAPTPSAAAELISPDIQELIFSLQKHGNRLKQAMRNTLSLNNNILTSLNKRLRHPGQRLQEYSQTLDELEQRLQRAWKNCLTHSKHQLRHLIRALDAVSPLATLNRGYSILSETKTQKIVYSCQEVKAGDKITAKLVDGSLDCIVEKILPTVHSEI